MARSILKTAGYRWNKQGQLLDPQGHPVIFELNTNTGNLEREAIGVQIKEDLAKLGMTVYFKPVDFNILVGRLDTANWEAMIMGLTGSPIEPHSGKNVWSSQGALHLFNQRNPKRDSGSLAPDPWEAEIDAVFEAGARTFDLQQRKALYNRYQQIVYDERPMIYLYSPKQIVAVRNRIQNLDPTPFGIFHNLESIWVKK